MKSDNHQILVSISSQRIRLICVNMPTSACSWGLLYTAKRTETVHCEQFILILMLYS